jgi:ABC-type transport system substrate-binding protein
MKVVARFLVLVIGLATLPAWGGVRPRYGGTLRVAMVGELQGLDPQEGDAGWEAAVARARVTPLLFDTLVRVDAEGRGHPQLAVAWQADRSFKRWQFWLRPGVRFWDGTALKAETVVAGLGGRAEWNARVDGELVVIESEASRPGLLAELALARNAVVRRGEGGKLMGTGPFLIQGFVAGKSLDLAANDGSWGGRPFVDAVQIEFGKSLREQMVSLQLGKVDLIEVGAEQIGKVESEGRKAQVSLPVELVALVGGAGKGSVVEALSLAVNRKSIQSVLLRGGSEAAGGVLPEWMTGTGVLFSVQVDLEKGQGLVESLAGGRPGAAVATKGVPPKGAGPWTLSCDAGDGLARLLAERVALNAREVGLAVQVVTTSSGTVGAADMRLERIALGSGDPGVALGEVGRAVGVKVAAGLSAPGEIYVAEKKVMEEAGVAPLFHLPLASLVGERVRGFSADKLGGWELEEVWVEGL